MSGTKFACELYMALDDSIVLVGLNVGNGCVI